MSFKIVLLKFSFQNIASLTSLDRAPFHILFNSLYKLCYIIDDIDFIAVIVVKGIRVNRYSFVPFFVLMKSRLKLTMVD